MGKPRWVIRDHELYDYKINAPIGINKDKGYIYILNEIYNELQEIKELITLYGEGPNYED